MPKSAPLRPEDDVPLATLTSSSVAPTPRTPATSWAATTDASGRETAGSSNPPPSGMESAHTRRRSSSGLVGLGISANHKNGRRHQRTRSENIVEANEDEGGLLTDGDLSDKDDEDFANWDDDSLEDDEETGLTGTERKARAEKKRRGTRLSDRVASGDLKLDSEQSAHQSFLRDSLVNIILICLWYFFSISISVVSSPSNGLPESTG
jgi:solute carrier family 35, member C2